MGIIDEIRDHDGITLTEIVLPLMNVDRRDAQGDVDPTEPNQQQVMITSAGTKGTYAKTNKFIGVLKLGEPSLDGCGYLAANSESSFRVTLCQVA